MASRPKTPRAAAKEIIASSTAPELRALTSALLARSNLAQLQGQTFAGRRDTYSALGYQKVLKPVDYRARYNRGGIAKRLVEAFPHSTWRGGGELVENDDPEVETPFEKAFFELNQRLSVWSSFLKTDILAGLGRFAVILLGAPGTFDSELTTCTAENLKYLSMFSERDVVVESYVTDTANERFGQIDYYGLRRVSLDGRAAIPSSRVHHSRIIHVAENLLDDPVFGTPRLEAVWNYLDDLEKVVGGGAEAFWKRVDGGKQFKLDPTLNPTEPEKLELAEQIELYTNDLQRILKTRGVDIQDLGSNVANFKPSGDFLMDLIAATSGIPQRILMGSERGELASSTDQSNYDDRVEDRRNDFAATQMVRPFIDRLIKIGVLPTPTEYETRWPETDNLDDDQRMALAEKAAKVNKEQGETVITSNEIRDRILGWDPLEEIEGEDLEAEGEEEAEEDTEENSDAEILAAAARSPIKKIRLMRLSYKGRKKLAKMKKKKKGAW